MIDQDNPQQEAMALGTTTAVTLWPHLKMILGAFERLAKDSRSIGWASLSS